jgi:hypothetical protein
MQWTVVTGHLNKLLSKQASTVSYIYISVYIHIYIFSPNTVVRVISLFPAYTYDWAMLEPIMTVEVNAPQEFQGAVLAGLTKRNAIFLGTDSNEGYFTSYCEVVICTSILSVIM